MMLSTALTISLLRALPSAAAYSSRPYYYPTSTESCFAATGTAIPPDGTEWSGWGANVFNNRWASQNTEVTSSSISSLTQHCKIDYPFGVSAAPTISGDVAYYPTWGGLLVALNYKTCQTKWQVNVTQLIAEFAPITELQLAISSPVSRTSPQIDGDILFFGTLTHAVVFAAEIGTGGILGSIQINPHPTAILTMSPTFYGGQLFIGSSSQEEIAAAVPRYLCCSFVGNMVALTFDRSAGEFSVSWNVSMLPDPPGNWSGAAIWGSQPAIDPERSQVLIATGNVYTLPTEFNLCQNQSMKVDVIAQGLTLDPCLPPDVYEESVIALDLDTGLVNWVNQLSPLDAYNVACNPTAPADTKQNCPFSAGPDADFGMAPTFVPGSNCTPHGLDTVVVGQKNGNLYAISAQAGRLFWSTATSPDGSDGGLSFGIAVDDSKVYFTAINFNGIAWQLQPSNRTISDSAFGAASLADGTILWDTQSMPNTSLSLVPPSVVNDVMLVGRSGVNTSDAFAGTGGSFYALNSASGAFLKEISLDANFHGGIAVQDQYVMFGTGYQEFANGTGSFYVMSV